MTTTKVNECERCGIETDSLYKVGQENDECDIIIKKFVGIVIIM